MEEQQQQQLPSLRDRVDNVRGMVDHLRGIVDHIRHNAASSINQDPNDELWVGHDDDDDDDDDEDIDDENLSRDSDNISYMYDNGIPVFYEDEDEDDDDDDDGNNSIPVHELKVVVLPDREQEFREGYDLDVENHLCAICFSLLDDPVGCGSCQGRFCRPCLKHHENPHRMGYEIPVVNCPTCRTLMFAGIVSDPHYAAFLATEPFTCRYARCGLRILANQTRRHELLFCQGVRVACKYAPLGCDWKGFKLDVKHHESSGCNVANNRGLLAFAQKVQHAETQLRSRIQNLEARQARGTLLLQQHIQRTAQRINNPDAANGPFSDNHNAVSSQTPSQQQFHYKATNPFHLMRLTFHVLVTPGEIHTRGPWRDLVFGGEERASVHNALALFPTFLLVSKLMVRFWHNKEHLGAFLYQWGSLAVFSSWRRQQDQDHFFTMGGEESWSSSSPVIEMTGPFSLGDWIRLVALSVSCGIALASLSSDSRTPLAWHGDNPREDFENYESELNGPWPRPLHRKWMKANFTVSILAIYYCAIPLVQSILQGEDDNNNNHKKSFATIAASVFYASLAIPSLLICFLDASSRNGRHTGTYPAPEIVRSCITWGNATPTLIVVLAFSIGSLVSSSIGEFLDGWHLVGLFVFVILPAIVPTRLNHNLEFLYQPCFQHNPRTGHYLLIIRCVVAVFAIGWGLVRSIWKLVCDIIVTTNITAISDLGETWVKLLDDNMTASCPAPSTSLVKATLALSKLAGVALLKATLALSKLAGVVLLGVRSRCVIVGVVLGTMALLDKMFLFFGCFGIYLYEHCGGRDRQWDRRPILKKVYWTGTCFFLLYMLALKRIWDV